MDYYYLIIINSYQDITVEKIYSKGIIFNATVTT